MRILLINDYAGKFGGAEEVVFDLRKLLEEKGHEVKVFGSDKKASLGSFLSRWFSVKYYYRTKRLIRSFKPDIVHCHNLSRVLSPSPLLAAKSLGVPSVMTIHDFYLYCPKTWGIFSDGRACKMGYNALCPFYQCEASKVGYQYVPYHFLKWLKASLHRYIIGKNVDYFICPSRELRRLIAKSLGVPDSKITHLPCFIESKNESADWSGVNPKLFLFVGRLSREKGVDIAIRAVDHLVKMEKLVDIKLRIIGDGPEMKNLLRLVAELGLSKNIEFTGYVDNKNLDRHYQEACAVLIPSVWLENDPIVALESMANGKPIIASKSGGLPDLVEHNKSGYLFEMGDYEGMAKCMEELYDNRTLSIELGRGGFERFKGDFDAEKHYKRLMGIYKSLVPA